MWRSSPASGRPRPCAGEVFVRDAERPTCVPTQRVCEFVDVLAKISKNALFSACQNGKALKIHKLRAWKGGYSSISIYSFFVTASFETQWS